MKTKKKTTPKTPDPTGLPRPYVASAKNPKRPTAAELWKRCCYLEGELSAAEERLKSTLEGKLEKLAEDLEAVGQTARNIDHRLPW